MPAMMPRVSLAARELKNEPWPRAWKMMKLRTSSSPAITARGRVSHQLAFLSDHHIAAHSRTYGMKVLATCVRARRFEGVRYFSIARRHAALPADAAAPVTAICPTISTRQAPRPDHARLPAFVTAVGKTLLEGGAMTPDQLPLQRLYHWEKARADEVYLSQPLGGGTTRDWTWAQAAGEARRIAAYLQSLGIPKGANVALLSKN